MRGPNAPPSTAVRGYRQAKQAIGQVARKALPKGTPDKMAPMSAPPAPWSAAPFPPAPSRVRSTPVPGWRSGGPTNARFSASSGRRASTILAGYDLERLDAAANSVQNRATAYAGLAGGVAGAGGILIAALAVAVVINIGMRTIRRIGLCYGCHATDHLELRFMLEVL